MLSVSQCPVIIVKKTKLLAYILKKRSAFVKSNRICQSAVKNGCPAPKALTKNILHFLFLSTGSAASLALRCVFPLTYYFDSLSVPDASCKQHNQAPKQPPYSRHYVEKTAKSYQETCHILVEYNTLNSLDIIFSRII